MAKISVILSCYNTAKYLSEAIQSVIHQSFENWELIFVDDGSTDNSLEIAKAFEAKDSRIKTVSKENGGYVSARLFGLDYISSQSEYLHFFDADDLLHPQMFEKLIVELDTNSSVGAAYCNHILMDAKGNELGLPSYGIRKVPTKFWMKSVAESKKETKFISIFCWACKMIEPMTIIRRSVYEQTNGWDIRFGKGKGNIGDGTLLFAELALIANVVYLESPLYYYRKHENQATSSSELNKLAGKKVLAIWKDRLVQGTEHSEYIKAAIICQEHRMKAYSLSKSLKHQLRYFPFRLFVSVPKLLYHWLVSLQLILYKSTKIYI